MDISILVIRYNWTFESFPLVPHVLSVRCELHSKPQRNLNPGVQRQRQGPIWGLRNQDFCLQLTLFGSLKLRKGNKKLVNQLINFWVQIFLGFFWVQQFMEKIKSLTKKYCPHLFLLHSFLLRFSFVLHCFRALKK